MRYKGTEDKERRQVNSYSSLVGYTGHLEETTRNDETITYKFHVDPTPDDGYTSYAKIGGERYYTFNYTHTSEQYQFVRDTISDIDSVIDLDFAEVSADSSADITIYRSMYNSHWGSNNGYLYISGTCYYLPSGAEISWYDYYYDDSFTDVEKSTIVHEIGHAIGLSHPDGVGANPEWDQHDSIMSYNGEDQTEFQTLDVSALHSLWGVEDDHGIESTINDYVASNPDLIESIGTNADLALSHYTNSGIAEGRVFDSFDEFGYLASNPDLVFAFGSDGEAATNHFIEYGFHEGRSDDLFKAQAYGSANPDLVQAFGNDNSLLTRHYVENGLAEGRSTSPSL